MSPTVAVQNRSMTPSRVSSSRVTTAEMRRDGRQPARFEKKRNMGPRRTHSATGRACTTAEEEHLARRGRLGSMVHAEVHTLHEPDGSPVCNVSFDLSAEQVAG